MDRRDDLTRDPGFAPPADLSHNPAAPEARLCESIVPSVVTRLFARRTAGRSQRYALGLLAAGLLVVAAVVLWSEVKYRFIPKRFGVVEEGHVYRSGQLSDQMLEPTLRKYGIDVVIDLNGVEPGLPGQAHEIEAVAAMGLVHRRFPLAGDGTGDFDVYTEAVAALILNRRAGRRVLVHCAAGSQRTGSVIAAYELLYLGKPPSEVYETMQCYDWEPCDSPMLEYLNAHLPTLADRLYERGLISQIPDPVPVVGP